MLKKIIHYININNTININKSITLLFIFTVYTNTEIHNDNIIIVSFYEWQLALLALAERS